MSAPARTQIRRGVGLAAAAALDALAAAPASAPVRTVGFIDHERTDVMDEARAKGCTDVMAKGQFANALPKLLAGLSASP